MSNLFKKISTKTKAVATVGVLLAAVALTGSTTGTAAPADELVPAGRVSWYEVKSGDTWSTIVTKLCDHPSTSAERIAFSNVFSGNDTSTLRSGQYIPVDLTKCAVAPPATTTTTAPPVTTTTTVPPTTTTPPVTTLPPVTTTTLPPTTTTTTPPATTVPPAGVLWSEDFSTAAGMNRLQKDVAFGDNVANGAPPQAFNGDHNHACQGPTTVRPLVEDNTIGTHFWWCAPSGPDSGHFMTGMNTLGYSMISFAPSDNGTTAKIFPATANKICWDQNITELGARKWTQVVVVNADRYIANGSRIDYINPEFNDNGGQGDRAAVRLAGDDFLLNNLRNTTHYFQGQSKIYSDWNALWDVTDKATRYRMCLTDNGNGTVTRTQARPGGVTHTTTGPGRFPAGPRVFILEDDSYNPMKAFEDGQTQVVADPFTWHWDNIVISSS